MSGITNITASGAVLTLDGKELAEVARVARTLCGASRRVDDPAWVAAARAAWDELPIGIRRGVRQFRRDSASSGTLLLRNLPVDEQALPSTPAVSGSVEQFGTVPAAILTMIACGLGDPAAFQAEKSGALVQDVVPVPGKEDVQGNMGSAPLAFHNENAFHQHRPDFIMLLCLRADHDGAASLRTACIRNALPLLTEGTRAALGRPEFATEAPPSFGISGGQAPPHPVLSGDPADPDVRVDFHATCALTLAASAALAELQARLDEVGRNVRLSPGDLVIADNRVTVHGRTSFRPRYDGRDRWLQRTFVLSDLRRSRDSRPADGYVLAR
jgi:L-asparagine oxygenase